VNWDAIGAIGNVLAAVGVTATLIYLVVQLKHNNRQLRLTTANVVTEELQAIFSLLAADESLCRVFNEAASGRELEGTNRTRFYAFVNNLMRIHENAYLQRQEGAIPEAHWEGLTRLMIDVTDMPGFASYWVDRKHWSSNEYGAFVEAEILSIPAHRRITGTDETP
jgi:hypothetical protein